MFRDLPRYDEYRSNVSPWLGDLPKHWLLARTKTLLGERTRKGYPEEPLLAATQRHGVIKKSDYENRTVTATKDLHLLKLVEVGDFVISLRSFQGGIERCYHRGIISPAYTVLTAKDEAHREFLAYLFKSRPYVDSLTLAVTGIREGQNIDYSRLEVDLLPVPPAEEQAAIVKYLTHANARIDKAIVAKRRLIALLEEQKQAKLRELILGVAYGEARKVSGLDWVGSIPDTWRVRKLRSLFMRQGSGTTPADDKYFGGYVPWVMSGDLNDSLVSETARSVTSEALAEVSSLRLHPWGSLVIAMYGATIGKTGILSFPAATNQACSVLSHPRRDVNVEYIQLAMRLGRPALQELGAGGGQPNVNAEKVAQFRVPLPPVAEQQKIVHVATMLSHDSDSACSRVEREIGLLQEFRTRLVADVVTGQVDVRAVAATLPDAAPSATATDEVLMEFDGLLGAGDE